MRRYIFLIAIAVFSSPVLAGDQPEIITFPYEGNFEDAALSLETAIEAQGLKVDHVSHIGQMLARTADAAGAEGLTFDNARIVQFCSATISRKMMEINPDNIGYCPYQIFVYQLAGESNAVLGYRDFPQTEMQEVKELIEKIIGEALAF